MKLIIGMGVSGKAAAALLTKNGIPFVAVDRNGPLYDTADVPLDLISQVILSPGIPRSHPLVQRALQNGIEVIGELEMALREVKNRCIGITGSNGKTTTCSLITHVLTYCGLKARAVGNIGAALSDYLLHQDPSEILIIELSSFQLETLFSKKMELGVVLNITPNHLDRHASREEYAFAKIGMRRCVEKLLISKQVQRDWNVDAEVFDASTLFSAEYRQFGVQNVQAAERVCAHLGISQADFLAALPTFQKPLHRMEFLGEKNGRIYYNDSKATSVEAVVHGVSLLQSTGILIAGGVHKGASYKPWIASFRGKVRKIIAFGAAAPLMEAELAADLPLERVATLEEAAERAAAVAERGEFILLSPGCSSYDQFVDYQHRGDAFRKWFKKEMT